MSNSTKKFEQTSQQKKFEGDLKIKLRGKRPYPSESFKYLGVKIVNLVGNVMLMIFLLN